MSRKICVVTGARSEYGILIPVLRAIQAHPGLTLQLVVTGMHLSDAHGRTIDLIAADGFDIAATVPMLSDVPAENARGLQLARGIDGMCRAFATLSAEVILLLGDRIEPFAAAAAAMADNRFIAHVHGGDRSAGGQDEAMRHAVTKLAHLHFAASPASRERLLRLGEEADRVFLVGAPGLDAILIADYTAESELRRRYSFLGQGPFLLVVQHPVSTRPETASTEMTATLSALSELNMATLLVLPNNDPGSLTAMAAIEQFGVRDWLHVVPNLPRADFLGALRSAAALVGNSSSGMIEAPAFGTPVVNIGARQEGREHGAGVVHVPTENAAITGAIRNILTRPTDSSRELQPTPYGDGTASRKIADILASVSLSDDRLQKRITY